MAVISSFGWSAAGISWMWLRTETGLRDWRPPANRLRRPPPVSNLSDVIPQVSTCARFGTVSGVQHESNLPFELDGNSRLATRLTVSCALNPSAPGEVVVIYLRQT